MNQNASYIRSRLSLRRPQSESLDILSKLVDLLELKKSPDLSSELEKVKSLYPICQDFEREFPSVCFALATGVGKTRLMGAFIAYLFLEKGIRNFFVMGPNLTVYQKLITDLSESSHPKYVFKGIGDFAAHAPRIVTGDTYERSQEGYLFSDVTINVFNISKLNSETRGGKEPRIKRLHECLGDSYFNHLASLDDLVLLMDESHHYRADRGMAVINELNPILGLELTATPQVERGGRTIKFKNVVYEYSLAQAIEDGFVKEPAVATRKNFDPSNYGDEDLDRVKLEDGLRIHEDTKVALDIYARDSGESLVKPFVLVVAKDTDHAARLRELIQSTAFFEGRYADKVMEIHSAQTGSEKEENIAQLLTLEKPDNRIEIVIHVNMLKEGWDVTNLYTIIPLRAAASMTLREQTIGRGLRLPYGKITGAPKVDKLTIIAHDRFQEIVDLANQPDSIIKQKHIITIDEMDLEGAKEVVTAHSIAEQELHEEAEKIANIEEPEEKKQAQLGHEAKKNILSILPALSRSVRHAGDLSRPEIRDMAIKKIEEKLQSEPQKDLFAGDIIAEAKNRYNAVVADFVARIIEIPRIVIQQTGEVRSGFRDFDLDVGNLNYQPVSEEIIRRALQSNEIDSVTGDGRIRPDRIDNIIVNELINYSEIDYDEQVFLLMKLAGEAVAHFRTYLKEDDLINVVQYHKKAIAEYIYAQMMQDDHFYVEEPEFEKPEVYPFTKIEEPSCAKSRHDGVHDFRETVTPTSAIPSKVFSGFQKACHILYKFDSKTEKDFAVILEDDSAVLKWLRPAMRQFNIWYNHNSQQYVPDFVVETADAVYMVETKMETDMSSPDVAKKTQAALEYCRHATDYTTKNGGKPWKYVLIPHNAVMLNMSFEGLAMRYEVDTIPQKP